ncbi:hypothetical protein D5S17_11485 [Pseudonocardiaceae bacterium YIM PH 21723]|nr:hypothetical protein D5S17_11485 [Pseudonocardiaceae bacterium YIM PH 21723]
MGASGWDYYVDYTPDPREALLIAQLRELAGGTFYWPGPGLPRPTNLAELRAYYQDESNEWLMEGTHSILDIFMVMPAGSPDDFGTILPLPADRVRAVFGTDTPTREQFEAAHQGGAHDLDEFPRWSGRFTTLYENGVPAEIAIWGISGD